jgi:uncharacterized 2Fe-2S/4Fe-4S cluster protein (DUF4445 family)
MYSGRSYDVKADKGQSLLTILRERGFNINSFCGGTVSCGKCKVMISPAPAPTEADRRLLSSAELERGIRLACVHKADDGITVTLPDYLSIHTSDKGLNSAERDADSLLSAAIDIGTTTLVLAVFNRDGTVAGSITENNAQASYGADVISRIRSERHFPGKQHALIISQINRMSERLFEELGISQPLDLFICGNTAMLHFLFGKSPVSMGEFPYKPLFLDYQSIDASEIGLNRFSKVTSLPCLASFAGADITAGILSVYEDSGDYKLLIDLGTNAEIALFNNKRCYVATAAAGPAFEGANIRHGMPSTAGAIKAFRLINGNINAETIDNAEIRGICGSGLISLVAELLRNRIIDKSGRMFSDCFEISEDVALYPKDVRELQLAKAAVRGAVEELIGRAGIGYSDISKLYLSGGFGTYINTDDAAFIGLIPAELKGRAKGLGNSALNGTVLYAVDDEKKDIAARIKNSADIIDLALTEDFAERLIKYIDF